MGVFVNGLRLGWRFFYSSFLRLFSVWILTSAHVSYAQQASEDIEEVNVAKVEELLIQMGIPQQVDESATEVLKLYLVKVDDNKASDQVKALVSDYRVAMTKLVEQTLSWEAVKPVYLDVYTKALQAEDVTGLLEFVNSPLGSRFMQTQKQAGLQIRAITSQQIQQKLTEPASTLSAVLRESLNKIDNQTEKANSAK